MSRLLLEYGRVWRGRLVARVSRFTVELEAPGGRRRCHLHDPGRLLHLLRPGAVVYASDRWRPGRKTGCDVAAVVSPEGVLVLEDTRLPNRLLPAALPLLAPGLEIVGSERMVNGARMDFVAEAPGGIVLVEVKATNLVSRGFALFPDAPSARAVRQLEVLASARAQGAAYALVVFTVLRHDASRLRPNRRVDPVFASKLCGLSGRIGLLAYTVEPRVEGEVLKIYMGRPVPVEPC